MKCARCLTIERHASHLRQNRRSVEAALIAFGLCRRKLEQQVGDSCHDHRTEYDPVRTVGRAERGRGPRCSRPQVCELPGHGEAAHLTRSCAARWSLSWRCASPRTLTLCLRRVRCRSRGPCATRKCKMGRERALSLLLSQTIRRKPFKPANRALANDMLPR